jgi:hypothetical protein
MPKLTSGEGLIVTAVSEAGYWPGIPEGAIYIIVSVTDKDNNPITNLNDSNFYVEPALSPAHGSFPIHGYNGWDGYPRSYEFERSPGRGTYTLRIRKFETETGEDPPPGWNSGVHIFFIEVTTNIDGRSAKGQTIVTARFP